MKKLMLGLLVFGFTTQFMFSQVIKLSEVHLDVNYKYLDATTSEELAQPVQMLEEEVAFYNLKESDLYSYEHDTYHVSFFIPEGKIVAAYNADGEILRTVERFENIRLPISVFEAIINKYPNWEVAEDTYKVNYFGRSGIAKKEYKVKIKNGFLLAQLG